MYELEKSNMSNPVEFWRNIEKLRPSKKKRIPLEVVMEDGSVSDVFDVVLNKWKCDFEELLTPPAPDSEPQTQFWNEVECGNREAESSWDEHNVNQELNVPITKKEVAAVLMNCKKGKAPGIDGVISDTLKNKTSINVLTALFDLC